MWTSQNGSALQNFLASLFHRKHKLFLTLATQHLLTLMKYNLRRQRTQNPSFYVSLFSPSVFYVGVICRLSRGNIFLTFLYLVCVDLSGEKSKKKNFTLPSKIFLFLLFLFLLDFPMWKHLFFLLTVRRKLKSALLKLCMRSSLTKTDTVCV